MKFLVYVVLAVLLTPNLLSAQETIYFASLDSIEIAADLYIKHDREAPFIILFHQATFSRGEYLEIAPKLNEAGFNCMAVDLRSGYAANGVSNITAHNAKKAKMPYRYIDTYQDITAAIKYTKENLANDKLIIWGSSYSSSLVLKYAGENMGIDGVISFSPGEFFKQEGKPEDFITSSVSDISCPVFITSKRFEKQDWIGMYKAIVSEDKTYFLPEFDGKHGSMALWESTDGHEKYWEALQDFLNDFLD